MPRPPEARLYLDPDEIVVDSFAGGGGASQGIAMALGRGPDIAINHDHEAIALHAANHPEAEHYCEDVWHVDPIEATRGRPVGLMWLSPDCKHFSKAKGGKPVSPRVRGLAWVAVRWAKAVKPRIIVLENVEEFQQWGPIDKHTQRPNPAKAGTSFRIFCGRLRGLGYEVQHKELKACDFGAPTIRKRLFLIARCDGQPIVWPKATHGKKRKQPWRSAGECIDFSIPCPSIFLTQADVKRLGLKVKRPLAANTMRRVAAGLERYVLNAPKPYLVQYHSAKRPGEDRSLSLDTPLPTLDTSNRFGLVAPVLVPRYGEDPHRNGGAGQEPRCRSVTLPMPTIVPTGNGASLVAAFLAKHQSERHAHEVQGASLHAPSPTVKTRDSSAIVAATLAPMPLDGTHAEQVRAFLVSYYGTDQRTGDLNNPIATITPRDRFGLVTVQGVDYQIVDIGMRMLEPRELYRAQGFPDTYIIDLRLDGKPLSKGAQVRMVGNSVCPDVAAAIIKANVARRAAAKERVA